MEAAKATDETEKLLKAVHASWGKHDVDGNGTLSRELLRGVLQDSLASVYGRNNYALL